MERAVRCGLGRRRQAELVTEIGVDEKAFRKEHSYLTPVNDLVRGVLYGAEDRKLSSLDGLWETLTVEQISAIRAVAMDTWDPYIASLTEHVSAADAKIVFDKFHVAKHLGDLWTRRKEHTEGCWR
jgi:transposase